MMQQLPGLPLTEALALLDAGGIKPPEVTYTNPPFASFETDGRTPRVVAAQEGRLIVAYFKDGNPEEKES
jgi:hypothetical protein